MKKIIFFLLSLFIITQGLSQSSGQWIQKTVNPGQLLMPWSISDTGYAIKQGTDELWAFDPTTNLWSLKSIMPDTIQISARFIHDKKALLMGSLNSILYEYDSELNTWATKSPFPGQLRGNCELFQIDSCDYVGLGKDFFGNQLSDIWKYNFYTDTWTQLSSFSFQLRDIWASFAIGNDGFVGLGVLNNNFPQPYGNDFYKYDPFNDTWVPVASLPAIQRYATSGLSVDSKGYILGGEFTLGPGQVGFSDEFWRYDSFTDTWLRYPDFGGGAENYMGAFSIDKTIYAGKSTLWAFTVPEVFGYAYVDGNLNCQKDTNEVGIPNISFLLQPNNIYVTTDSNGFWSLDSLPDGIYTVQMDTMNPSFAYVCSSTAAFTVQNGIMLSVPQLGVISTSTCNRPNVSIVAPILRRCNTHPLPVLVSACNDFAAGTPILGAYVEVTFDPPISVVSIPLPYTVNANTYTINVGDLYPSQCTNFTILMDVDCNVSIGQTLCMQAVLLPLDSCALDTNPGPGNCNLPWDRSSLSVTGECVGDSLACFTITNSGSPVNGNMLCYSRIRVYYNGVLTDVDSVMLPGGGDTTLCFPADGSTIRLEVDQHPLHPGNSHPNAVVELCGDSTNWIPGLINAQALDDADPNVDIFCGEIVGSFDPNDKQGFPTGLGVDHEVLPNQDINYLIRFQNTGNDTAFTIIIRDTLDANLNLFTLRNGPSSHPNAFRILPGRLLEWRFNNILLPDSNVNEPESHGFVSFTVSQAPDLPDYTELYNTAYIYFDGNAPVITNQTQHTIKRPQVITTQIDETMGRPSPLLVYPNPAADYFTIRIVGNMSDEIGQLTILDLKGKLIAQQQVNLKPEVKVISSTLPSGIYVLQVRMNNGKVYTQKLVVLK